ncbi:pyruvate formate lyase family protein [Lacrimispora brassicae]
MTLSEQGNYMLEFFERYYSYPEKEKGEREAACLEIQYKYAILFPEKQDLLLGRYEKPGIGFAMQDFGMGYYQNQEQCKAVLANVAEPLKSRLTDYLDQWEAKTGRAELIRKTPKHILDIIPNDNFKQESNVGFWLCRMSSTQLDFDKLLRLGIPGLTAELEQQIAVTKDASKIKLYQEMIGALKAFQAVIRFHRDKIQASDHPHRKLLTEVLTHIADNRPFSFHEAVQLMYLYAIVSGTYNYGRMDEYLGDFLTHDLTEHKITRAQAKELLCCLWHLIIQRKTTWNARVIIGGKGRRNERNADLCARLIIEVASIVRDVLPQLTLRFYGGQDEHLMEDALKTIGTGCVYPMLYNDEINISSVQRAFQIPEEEAVNYLPFGCGEYVIYHKSVGTPSDIINILKALEITLFDGYDYVSKKQLGLKTGLLTEYDNFEDFFESYCKQAERYITIEAEQQMVEYNVAQEHSPFLLCSILFDDCIAKGKAIFDGGAKYKGGTLELYGNTNTSDSLYAIQQMVFERKEIGKAELLEMIRNDFAGYEKQWELLKNVPKYGNDNSGADLMAKRVHEHVCNFIKEQAKRVGLDSYLAVIINNSANSELGEFTLASADGRKAREPMANANNPSGGSDVNGLTAMLNSLVKLRTDIHAGSVQNLKFSKEMFTTYYDKTKMMIKVYFENGGSQLMMNVLGREDLENALKEPEKYKNLIVRVGGFCARFVELSPNVQREIMSRTMY